MAWQMPYATSTPSASDAATAQTSITDPITSIAVFDSCQPAESRGYYLVLRQSAGAGQGDGEEIARR